MMPVVPEAKPPSHSIVATLGFQSPQVDMSDQIFQTLSGGAVVSTEVPYSDIVHPFLDCFLALCGRETISNGDENGRPKSTSTGGRLSGVSTLMVTLADVRRIAESLP